MISVSRTSGILIVVSTLLLLTLPGLGGGDADAKSHKDATYAFEQVWPAAIRFLRIDEKLRIVEKDAESGYVLFEMRDDRKLFQGALEIVRTVDPKGRRSVRLVLRIEDRPSYMEAGILKRLAFKLRDELGAPAPPPPSKKPSKNRDEKPDKKPEKPAGKSAPDQSPLPPR